MKRITLLFLHVICLHSLQAQNGVDHSTYNPHELFAQSFSSPAGNTFRSAKVVPGPSYWQNKSSYLIHATLSEKDTSV